MIEVPPERYYVAVGAVQAIGGRIVVGNANGTLTVTIGRNGTIWAQSGLIDMNDVANALFDFRDMCLRLGGDQQNGASDGTTKKDA